MLTDVADNSQRGTSERIREKMVKMNQVVRDQEERVREAERRLSAGIIAEGIVHIIEERVIIIVQSLLSPVESNKQAREAEKRQAAEKQVKEAERRAEEAERRHQEQIEAERRSQQTRQPERKAEERHWVVQRDEIIITRENLGGGGWGEMMVAKFRGTRVAAKFLNKELQYEYYHDLFIREMNMAARLRHPNLVQFIGASLQEEMVILTELMPTNLRQQLKQKNLPANVTITVSLDVAKALNYLHMIHPDPIIHRNISSANVLLEPLPSNRWRAKVTDYGSVNFQQQLQTVGPGSPVYAAPEAHNTSLQSPKMDIFSFGVLLVEMCTCQFPEVSARERLIASIQDHHWVDLIKRCIQQDKDNRPSAAELLDNIQTFE